MRILKYISLFLLSLLLLSCSGFKSSWKNFRAHYNTYYHAEKSFKAGLKKVEEQPVEVNPEQSQRVHPGPPNLAEEDFNNTIEKGADILRRFPDSKWTDDALFLIGKSYYYKGDFFLAIEKFEELNQLTENSRFRQEALVWKARSLLDLEEYGEGVSFITENLDAEYFSEPHRAEFRVLLAEHHAMQENWKEAADHLGDAIADLEESKLKGRTFFLYGQALERLERFGEAFFAYDNVASRFPAYDYVYWSRMKKAEVARKEGNLQQALSIYISMSRDDKNVSRLDRINYEIARTLEMQGDIEGAEAGYKELLYSAKTPSSGNVKAKTHYRLGKINSEYYNDLSTAAAYFDTASSQVDNINFLESKFDAERLSSAYGLYANLKKEISRLDSLLWLGSIQPSELDSVLKEIRQQKRASLGERVRNSQENENRLTNVNAGNEPEGRVADSSVYGFLNYKNSRLKQEAINEFNAVWGNRPLVDNWRRIEVVRSIGISSGEGETAQNGNNRIPLSETVNSEMNMDLSEIPTTDRQKNAFVNELANAKYRLGNLFFLTLNMPDSARTYFRDIIRNYPGSVLAPQSMYSLFELYDESGNEQQYHYWANRILREYPDSRFAEMVSAQINGKEGEIQNPDATDSQKLLTQFQNIEDASDSTSVIKAEQFRELAIANRSADLAPYIHYQAVKTYVELAKRKTDADLYNRFLRANTQGATPSEVSVSDSLGRDMYPFFGTHWDSVRNVVSEYDTLFPAKPAGEDLKILKKFLDSDTAARSRTEAVATKAEPKEPAEKGASKVLKACMDLGTNVEIVGGMSNFLSRVDYPRELREKNPSDEITYKVAISDDGKVSSANQLSKQALPGISKAFDSAIKNYLYFDPILINGSSAQVSCTITFPLKPAPEKVSTSRQVIPKEQVKTCGELDADMDVVGGMKNFLSAVDYPDEMRAQEIPGEMTFEIFIRADGKVNARRSVSASASSVSPLEQAFEKAINRNLYFDPMSLNAKVQNQSCKMTFPVMGGIRE